LKREDHRSNCQCACYFMWICRLLEPASSGWVFHVDVLIAGFGIIGISPSKQCSVRFGIGQNITPTEAARSSKSKAIITLVTKAEPRPAGCFHHHAVHFCRHQCVACLSLLYDVPAVLGQGATSLAADARPSLREAFRGCPGTYDGAGGCFDVAVGVCVCLIT